MKFQKSAVSAFLASGLLSASAVASAGDSSLYCLGSFSPAQKPMERIPLDAILATKGNDVSLEIRTVGKGETKGGLNRISGFESTGTINVVPQMKGASSFGVTFILQNYTGELKVYLAEENASPALLIYQGKCEDKKPLVQ